MAPCLFRDRGTGYYAVVRRSGKIVRKSPETDRLEIAKRELRDFQNGVERIGISAHNRRFGETIDEFVSSRTGASSTPLAPTVQRPTLHLPPGPAVAWHVLQLQRRKRLYLQCAF